MMGAEIRGEAGVAPASDEELLRAARLGDASALEALLVRYQPHLFRFGLRMCGNVEDASEVAQEGLISMARAVRDFRGDSSVSSWLYTIARRSCIKKRRRSKFAPARLESLDAASVDAGLHVPDPAPGPEETAANRELAAALIRAIDALEPPQREVLLLRDVEGLPAAEVARVLGISVVAVKSRLHRARVAVRETLAPLLESPAADTPRGATCPDVLALFTQHLDGDLDPRVCAAMEAHLSQCRRCQGTCESLKQVLAQCRQLPTPRVPASLAASVKTAIQTFLSQTQTGRVTSRGSI
jgi:RNA polymerase sigma-70 factor (ECF subfamily)